jgi:hypothetical protein
MNRDAFVYVKTTQERKEALKKLAYEQASTISALVDNMIGKCLGAKEPPEVLPFEISLNKERLKQIGISINQLNNAIIRANPLDYDVDFVGIGKLFLDVFENLVRYDADSNNWYFYDGLIWRKSLIRNGHELIIYTHIFHIYISKYFDALGIDSNYGIGNSVPALFIRRTGNNASIKQYLREAKKISKYKYDELIDIWTVGDNNA